MKSFFVMDLLNCVMISEFSFLFLPELFHTERLYVRKLKIMDCLFYRPIKSGQLVSSELIHLLFPNLEEVLDIHDQFNCSLKKKRLENPVVGDIGPVLLEMVRALHVKCDSLPACSFSLIKKSFMFLL